MKKRLLFLLIAAAIMAACTHDDPDNPDPQGPTERERNMVTEEMSWKLDSVLVIYNYMADNEVRRMYHEEDGIYIWTYTLYPSTYQFPDDMHFTNEMTGETLYLNDLYDYARDYCKYTCSYEGEIISAGYLMYYKDYFTFCGTKNGGWAEFRIVETDGWTDSLWTLSFNPTEADDGTVLERNTEYYSRVR